MPKNQALLIRVESDSCGYTSNYKHMRAKFVWVDSDKLSEKYACQHGEIVFADSYGDTRWANELEVNSQCDVGETKYYGMELRYRTYACGLHDCERMVKTLRSLETKLDKFASLHGYAENVSDYMFRLALVTKCKYIILEEQNFSWKFKAYSVDAYGKRAIEKLQNGNCE